MRVLDNEGKKLSKRPLYIHAEVSMIIEFDGCASVAVLSILAVS
jgi:hypothetical protein